MSIKLYHFALSPPSRAVLLMLKNLNIMHIVKEVDLFKKQHLEDDFLKLNPQHAVPIIVEQDGFVVADSHAINSYLVDKYDNSGTLYPKDIRLRSIVDHRLHLDTGVVFQVVRNLARAFFVEKTITGLRTQDVKNFENIYEILEHYLERSTYIAGNNITIADYSILTTLGNMEAFVPVNITTFPKLKNYIEKGNENIPFLKDLNDEGIFDLKSRFNELNFNFDIKE